MKEKVLTLLIGFMALFFTGLSVQAQIATLISDQPDYLPGTTATFTGTGFQAGETVKVQVLHYDGTSDGGEDHQSWEVTADADGGFITTWHVCEDDCLGSTLRATADGLSSLIQAEVIFTDAAFTSGSDGSWNNVNTWAVVARSGTITTTTGSQTVTGLGTLFLTEIAVGDRIYRNSNTIVGYVASITSNTTLILTVNASSSYSGTFMAKKIPGPADAVTIRGGDAVTITADASCLTLHINSTTNSENTMLKINQGQTLNVGSGTGSVKIGIGLPAGYLKVNFTSLSVDGTLRSGTIIQSPPSVSSGGYGNTNLYVNSTGIVYVNGDVSGTTVWNGTRTSEASVILYGTGRLNLTGSLTTSQLNLSLNSTVNYNREGSQTIRNSRYGNLMLSGGGNKSLGGGVTSIDGNLSISTATIANLSNFSHTASTLTLGGNGTAAGTWGSTSSNPLPTHTNNTYFAASTGKITVATGTCSNPPAPVAGNNSYIYDGLEKSASAVVGQGETITWYAAATGSLLASAPKGTNAGTYSAFAETGSAVPGCVSSTRTLITLIIDKAPLTVQATSEEVAYGSDISAFNYTYSGFVNNETPSAISGLPYISSTYIAGVGVAASPVVVTTAIGTLSALNYNFSLLNGEITINRKALIITANTFNKEYGISYTFTGTEFTNEGLLTVDRISSADITSSGAAASAPANLYDINISNALGSGLNNYSISYKKGNLTVEKRALIISVTASDKEYDGNAIAATRASIDGGLLDGDFVTASSINGIFDNKNVGDTKEVIADISIEGVHAGNYLFATTATTSANIKPKPLAITITATNKEYDGNATAIVTLSDDRVTDDILEIRYTGASFADKNVGTAKTVNANGISLTGVDASNYTFNATSATSADITARVLRVTAYDNTRYCGLRNPTFTGSGAMGAVDGEAFDVSYATTGGIASAAGSYPITPSIAEIAGGALLSNYSISLLDGILSVSALTSIDASASSTPVPFGSGALLSAKIIPSVEGVLVTFNLNAVLEGTGTTNSMGVATFTRSGLLPDVYTVEAIAGSNCLAPTIAYLPVYDPNGGFVTGGGWIISPIVTGKPYMETTGKANFGFVAKYKKGSNVVDGNTEFQFHAGGLNFKSNSHDAMSLIIAGAKAIYKGQGTINGVPGYSFMVSAIDGNKKTAVAPDAFRIKIWNTATTDIVYDNQNGDADNADATTTLGGGSIVIHEVKSGKISTTTAIPLVEVSKGLDMRIIEPVFDQKIKLGAYPNPFAKQATLAFRLPTNEQIVTLDIYDLKGSKISRMYEGKASANQTLEFSFNGSNLSAGMYFLRLTTPTKVENFKMIMTE